MPSCGSFNSDDVVEESQYDIRFIIVDGISYKKPNCQNIDSNILQRLLLKAVNNKKY